METAKNWFLYKLLGRPYKLYCRVDSGRGRAVLLLHGIASSGESWRHVVKGLANTPVRVIVFDLLGFGDSPKPKDKWVTYSAKDHARAVIAALKKQKVKGPITIVGHSMGCFVAIEVTAMRPGLVGDLLLYEPPFYVGLPASSPYRRRRDTYFKLYEAIIKRPPFGLKYFPLVKSLVSRITGFELTAESWVPFERSMRNAILKQTALNDLGRLTTPTQILYGRFDQLAFNDKEKAFFEGRSEHVEVAQLAEMHVISSRASKAIVRYVTQKGAQGN